MGEAKKIFIPRSSQEPFFESTTKFLLANGGYGSGKSTILCIKGIVLSALFPGTLGLIGRKTYPELRDTTRRVFFEVINKYFHPSMIKKWNKTENHLTFYNNSEVLFRALDDTFKVGSLELGWFGIDELSELDSEEWFQMLRGRLRHPAGPLKGFGATNPATKESWLYKLFVEKQDPKFQTLEIDTYENKDALPEGYIKDLEKFPPEWQERYLKGKWGIVPKGTRVFSKFQPILHLGDFKFNPYLPLMRGWDFGYRHPAVIFAQETDWSRLLILREMLGTEIQIDDFADQVIRNTNKWFPEGSSINDFCDIAGNQRSDKSKLTSVEVLRNKGIYPKFRKTVSLEGDLMIMNNKFDRLIGDLPSIGIDRKGCPIIIDALAGGYYRDKDGEATGDDYFDHLVDALRYIIVNMFGGRERRVFTPRSVADQYSTLTQARL